jgi:transposase-like protein
VPTGRGFNWDSHKEDQKIENIRFLLDTGMHPDRVARQLGISRDVLDKTMERHGRTRKPNTGAVTSTRAGAGDEEVPEVW